MKEWTVDEFVKECENLCWHQYTYDYSRMPEGICNGHNVHPYRGAWCSVVIDGCIHSMGAYSERNPDGYVLWVDTDGKERTSLEHIRYVLTR